VGTSTLPGARTAARTLIALVTALCLLTSAALAALGTGVDVSRWQHGGTLNWAKAKADGVTFAFIKATESSTYTNPYFAGDWSATRSLGIYHGAYHFARPSVGSAALQAKYFVKVAGLQNGSGVLPPVLDLESAGGLGIAQLRTWTLTWLQTVEDLTGRAPMIYVSPAFWESHLGNSTAFHHYALWVAHYGVSSPRVPGGWPTWSFWQTTSSGSVAGIPGRVDIDRFNGGPQQLARMANVTDGSLPGGTTGTTPPSPSPTSATLSSTRSAVYAGDSVTLSGALKAGTGGLANRTVGLWRQVDGATTSTRVQTAATDAAGRYSFTVTPTETASYVVKWAGGLLYLASTAPAVTVSLLQATPTTVVMASSRPMVYPGQNVVFSGALQTATGGVAGRTVGLWRQLDGATTSTRVQAAITDAAGRYSFTVTPTETASYAVKWDGGKMYSTSASTPVGVIYQPTIPTSLTLATDRDAAYSGQSVNLSGTLTSATGDLAGQTLEVFRQPKGSSDATRVARVSTNGAGDFALSVATTSTVSYKVVYPGASVYEPAVADPARVALLTPKATTVDLRSYRTTLRRGHDMTLYGHLRTKEGAGVVSRHVAVYRRYVGQDAWVRTRIDLTAAPGGYWKTTVSPRKSAVFRSVWAGGMRYKPSRSSTLRVTVR
jgi:GH25 family lysozyme M1 (1,4-beta-N-acetylmuramidase)